MTAPLCPSAPVLETERLLLRGWRSEDVEPYARMLADPATARFITRGGRPYDSRQAWAETAFLVGHWQLLGHGLFIVEERGTGAFVGRVGALRPRGWPGLAIAWAIAPDARSKGYATEAAAAALDWVFERFQPRRVVSLIHAENEASRRVAEKIGEQPTGALFSPLGEPCEVWELSRAAWSPRQTVPKSGR